jgi:uncharacterized protein YrrD
MMTKTMLLGASAFALMLALPAFAADTNVSAKTNAEIKAENALDKAGNAIERAADKTEKAVKNTYSDVKAYFTDDDDIQATSTINVQERNTAKSLIGTKVQDFTGKDIGKIDDIIISADGDAEMVIIQDGGVLGLGSKLAAFDFDVIEGYTKSNDILVKLTEKDVKSAKGFEYEAKAGQNVLTQPANTFRVSKVVGANVVDAAGKKVASVDTVVFDGDDAELAIVTFDKVLGMGGEKAALDIDAVDMINNNGKYSLKLNAQQSAHFENYKANTKAN